MVSADFVHLGVVVIILASRRWDEVIAGCRTRREERRSSKRPQSLTFNDDPLSGKPSSSHLQRPTSPTVSWAPSKPKTPDFSSGGVEWRRLGRGDAPNSQQLTTWSLRVCRCRKGKDGDCSRLTSSASPMFFEGLLGRLSEIRPWISSLEALASYIGIGQATSPGFQKKISGRAWVLKRWLWTLEPH